MDELLLIMDTPTQVTPSSGNTITIQNTMESDDDVLYVSTHGDIVKKWIEVRTEDSVQFSDSMYLMQKARPQWVFPAIEHSA